MPAFSLDELSFGEPLQTELPPPPPPPLSGRAPDPEPPTPDPVADAVSAGIAYVTVTDASGRVLFRRPATADEVEEALRTADEAEREGQAAMERIAAERFYKEALEDTSR